MPEISRFFGIRICMYHAEHGPPHFHAVYAEFKIKVDIRTGSVSGRFPPRALGLVKEWYHQHREDLLADWNLAVALKPLEKIEPLRSDASDFVHVVEARYLGGHRVWLRFDDGLEGEVDLEDLVRTGQVFEPLRDPAYFANFTIDMTLTWPNGADIAPESLHRWVLRARRSA